jgi:putative component of toxin-antitoxin plasmid stabilization module
MALAIGCTSNNAGRKSSSCYVGDDKSSQAKDIETAKRLADEWRPQ